MKIEVNIHEYNIIQKGLSTELEAEQMELDNMKGDIYSQEEIEEQKEIRQQEEKTR